jgi:hypothetical protein
MFCVTTVLKLVSKLSVALADEGSTELLNSLGAVFSDGVPTYPGVPRSCNNGFGRNFYLKCETDILKKIIFFVEQQISLLRIIFRTRKTRLLFPNTRVNPKCSGLVPPSIQQLW